MCIRDSSPSLPLSPALQGGHMDRGTRLLRRITRAYLPTLPYAISVTDLAHCVVPGVELPMGLLCIRFSKKNQGACPYSLIWGPI
eukprot:2071996-Rhodomonas_salina.1